MTLIFFLNVKNQLDKKITQEEFNSAIANLVSISNYNPIDKTDSMTQPVGKSADGKLWTSPGSGTGSAEAVLYTLQSLTTEQQAQARENIGAATVDGLKGEFLDLFSDASSIYKDGYGHIYLAYTIKQGTSYTITNVGDVNLTLLRLLDNGTVVQTVIERPVYLSPNESMSFVAESDATTVYTYGNNGYNGFSVCKSNTVTLYANMVMKMLANPYEKKVYAAGDYCIYNFNLYKCKNPIDAAEDWNRSNWDHVMITKSMIDDIKKLAYASNVISCDYESKTLPGDAILSEDITHIGNELWVFTHGSDVGGEKDGGIYRVNMDDWTYSGFLNHNLGHCGSVDYDGKNDRLIVCDVDKNESYNTIVYIYHNVQSWVNDGEMNVFDSIDLSSLKDIIGGITYWGACWGNRTNTGDRIIYLFTNSKIAMLQLGMGNNQLEKGAYTERESGRYNGSFNLLNYWYIQDSNFWETRDNVLQGIVFNHGKIYTSHGHKAITIAEWTLNDNHTAYMTQIRTPMYNADGTQSGEQGQGIDFVDGKLLLGTSYRRILTIDL